MLDMMGRADTYFSMLAGMLNEVGDMKKGASWRQGGWFGGNEPLKDSDQVLWTVAQANALIFNLTRAFAEHMCATMDTTGALDPTERVRRREEYKVQADRAISDYDNSIARWQGHPKRPKRVLSKSGVHDWCECTTTECGTRACKCVKRGDQCGPACRCKGGPNCQNAFKHADRGSSSSSSSASSTVGPNYDSDDAPPKGQRQYRTKQTAWDPQVALFECSCLCGLFLSLSFFFHLSAYF